MLVGGGLAGWYLYLSSDATSVSPVAVSEPAPDDPNAGGTTLHITIVGGAPATTAGQAPATAPSGTSAAAPSSGGRVSVVVHERPGRTRAAAAPNVGRVIVAYDGAIVFVGDNGVLKANTGDTSASGAVAIDASDSTITSGASVQAPGQPVRAFGEPNGAAAVQDAFAQSLEGRTVSIAGYENHSVNVAGNDQIATYDDSNLFINRNGQINANTGDTDSSGLNAVDVTRSFARSGDSGDGDDESEEPEEGEEPEEEADLPMASSASAASASANGTASSLDSDASTSATGRDPLVIGGDGYDDLAIRSSGNRNVVTYDDSNVVIGGTGDVNSQIGDSDTGGAVVMGIDQSHVEAGGSF